MPYQYVPWAWVVFQLRLGGGRFMPVIKELVHDCGHLVDSWREDGKFVYRCPRCSEQVPKAECEYREL